MDWIKENERLKAMKDKAENERLNVIKAQEAKKKREETLLALKQNVVKVGSNIATGSKNVLNSVANFTRNLANNKNKGGKKSRKSKSKKGGKRRKTARARK